jgi:transposase
VNSDLVPDDLWTRIVPMLPSRPQRRQRYAGRHRTCDRIALAGIIFVLRTGVTWRDVPRQEVGCSGVTAWRRLRDWTEAGVWPRLHAAILAELRAGGLLEMDDCAIDGSHVRALKGGSHTGPSPVDRARPGPEPSIISLWTGTEPRSLSP